MKTKRFHNWNPSPGELALVPGGPANAQYVAPLVQSDIEAINDFHRGYSPLRVLYTFECGKEEFSEVTRYDIKKGHWIMESGATRKTLKGVLASVKSYCGGKLKRLEYRK